MTAVSAASISRTACGRLGRFQYSKLSHGLVMPTYRPATETRPRTRLMNLFSSTRSFVLGGEGQLLALLLGSQGMK
jgi:hypothetical protein